MRVLVPRYSGFCPGVKQAEKRIFDAKRRTDSGSLFVLGDLIHNRKYIKYLEEGGVRTVEEPDEIPEGAVTVIRTHGVPRDMEKVLRDRFDVLDLTCSKVKKLQRLIKEHSGQGSFIVIAGKKSHPEVQGLVSYARESLVIETEADLAGLGDRNGVFQNRLRKGNCSRVIVVSQTTGSRELYEKTVESLKALALESREPELALEIESVDTICPVISLRETAALETQKCVNVTFVVGDRLSSNANRLYRRLRASDPGTHFVQGLDELKALELPLGTCAAAQVVSSSSTPDFITRQIVHYLENIEGTGTAKVKQ